MCRAVWTRFHPIAYAVQEVIHSGKLGKVKRFSADFSSDNDLDSQSSTTPFKVKLMAVRRIPAKQPSDCSRAWRWLLARHVRYFFFGVETC